MQCHCVCVWYVCLHTCVISQILGSGGTIVWVVLLSTVVLKAKYQLIHFAGVGVCLLGIGALAYADIHSGKSYEGQTK